MIVYGNYSCEVGGKIKLQREAISTKEQITSVTEFKLEGYMENYNMEMESSREDSAINVDIRSVFLLQLCGVHVKTVNQTQDHLTLLEKFNIIS